MRERRKREEIKRHNRKGVEEIHEGLGRSNVCLMRENMETKEKKRGNRRKRKEKKVGLAGN